MEVPLSTCKAWSERLSFFAWQRLDAQGYGWCFPMQARAPKLGSAGGE